MAATVRVTITASGFNPAVITVTVGDTVAWYNATAMTHTLKNGEPYHIYLPVVMRYVGGVSALDSEATEAMPQALSGASDAFGGTIPPGGILTHTFTTPGDFSYFLATAFQYNGRVIALPSVTSPDFTIEAWPATQAVTRGQSISYTVAVTAVNGFTQSVLLNLGGYPAGAAFAWSANPLTPTAGTSLVITPSAPSPSGTFTLAITGTSGNLAHVAHVSLVVVSPQYRDLTVQSLSVDPPNPIANQPTTITVVIGNVGGLPVTNQFYTSLYLDPASPPTIGQIGDYFWALGNLASGAVYTFTYNFGGFSTSGLHTLYAQADSLGNIAEGNETNNVRGPVSVNASEPLPDLAVALIATDPITPTLNQPFTLAVQVANRGLAPATGSFRVDWYADPATPPTTGTLGTEPWWVSDLAVGANVNLTRTMIFASGGAHTLYAQVVPATL